MSQWVMGFAHTIRDDTNLEIKNKMLEYLCDLMEDSQDFGWASAKGAHAVLLVRMDEGRVSWLDTYQLDRIRRAHAQKANTHPNVSKKIGNKTMACKYFQRNQCHHKTDHESGGVKYIHACAICYSQGKTFAHMAKDCKKAKNE